MPAILVLLGRVALAIVVGIVTYLVALFACYILPPPLGKNALPLFFFGGIALGCILAIKTLRATERKNLSLREVAVEAKPSTEA